MMSQVAGASEARDGTPLVWALLGHRMGDNLQVEALAERLGWPWERKKLAWRSRRGWTPVYGRMGASLAPLVPEARAQFRPPWPDLVISAGWRSVPTARWIGRQSGARLVHVGRPRAPLAAFDLVLTTAQYGVPEAPNVLCLPGPLNRLAPGRLAEVAEAWRERLAHLPRPQIAVLVGGDAPPMRLTEEAAARLGAEADALARRQGGSLLVATGPRTGKLAADALLAQVSVPTHSFIWGEGGENPYLAYLALADTFIVTSDSISMTNEASLTGRPLHLFELPRSGAPRPRMLMWLDRRLRAAGGPARRAWLGLVGRGWACPPRDPRRFHAALIARGRAVRLGDPAPRSPDPPADDGTERAVAAVRALFATRA